MTKCLQKFPLSCTTMYVNCLLQNTRKLKALEAFSKGVAREWGTRGIRSNIVAPGFMETTISASLTDEQRSKIYQRTSLKKATEVMSVAKTVVFLLTDAAVSITGSVIQVDNGTV